jgi:hypothetical protein
MERPGQALTKTWISRASWPRTIGASYVSSGGGVGECLAPAFQLWSVTVRSHAVFIVCRSSPATCADLPLMLNGMRVQIASIQLSSCGQNYGLDRPLLGQFVDCAAHAAHGDLGRSYLYHAPMAGPIKERFLITRTVGLTGRGIALSISIPLGAIAAMREGSAIEGNHPAGPVRPCDAKLLAFARVDHLVRLEPSAASNLRRRHVGLDWEFRMSASVTVSPIRPARHSAAVDLARMPVTVGQSYPVGRASLDGRWRPGHRGTPIDPDRSARPVLRRASRGGRPPRRHRTARPG